MRLIEVCRASELCTCKELLVVDLLFESDGETEGWRDSQREWAVITDR